MSDDDVPVIPVNSRPIDIDVRFLRQALEHARHTGARYVPLLFTGEFVDGAVCVGITTQRMITDQRPAERPPARERAPAEPLQTTWTLRTLTGEAILAVFDADPKTPLNAKAISIKLGIPGSDESMRQKVSRLTQDLVKRRQLKRTGAGRFPKYAPTGIKASAPVPTPFIQRQHRTTVVTPSGVEVTPALLLEQLRLGFITSKQLGDALDIPRKDARTRQRISDYMGQLVREGIVRVNHDRVGEGGGRVYELVEPETEAEVEVEAVA